MKRCVLISGAVGLVAAGISYAILVVANDTVRHIYIRLVALAIWPTGFFLTANEYATSNLEVATNFAIAISGNVILYACLGALLCGARTIVQKNY